MEGMFNLSTTNKQAKYTQCWIILFNDMLFVVTGTILTVQF